MYTELLELVVEPTPHPSQNFFSWKKRKRLCFAVANVKLVSNTTTVVYLCVLSAYSPASPNSNHYASPLSPLLQRTIFSVEKAVNEHFVDEWKREAFWTQLTGHLEPESTIFMSQILTVSKPERQKSIILQQLHRRRHQNSRDMEIWTFCSLSPG